MVEKVVNQTANEIQKVKGVDNTKIKVAAPANLHFFQDAWNGLQISFESTKFSHLNGNLL